MAAKYNSQDISDGFMRGTEVGVSVQYGTKALLHIKLLMKAKTVSNVYKELSKYKQDFSAQTWSKIEKASASGSVSFFYGLFDISAGGSYDYGNKNTKQKISNNTEAQRVAQALQSAEDTQIEIEGHLEAYGMSYIPVKAYIFVHLTQVSIDSKTSFNAIANNPEGRAASEDGSQKDVTGEGKLNVIQPHSSNAAALKIVNAQGVLKSEMHVLFQ